MKKNEGVGTLQSLGNILVCCCQKNGANIVDIKMLCVWCPEDEREKGLHILLA